MKPIVALLLVFTACLGVNKEAQASQPSPTPAVAIGGNIGYVVADLARETRFYHDVLRLDASDVASVTPPWGGPPMKGVTIRMPGATWALELLQAPTGAAPFRPRLQDPGALVLVFMGRNDDGLLARARAAHVPIVSAGGRPATVGRGGSMHSLLIQAPGGEFIETLQLLRPSLAPKGAPVPGPHGAIFAARFTVADANAASKLYGSLLGLTFRGGPVEDPGVQYMVGLPGKSFDLEIGSHLAGSEMQIEFFETVGVGKSSEPVKPHSAGTSFLRVSVPPDRAAELSKASEVADLLLVQPAK